MASNEIVSEQTLEPMLAETVSAALQRLVDGDDVDEAVDVTLWLLTHRRDASRLMGARQLRRLRNVLNHHTAAYKRLTDAVGAAFAAEVETAGMRLVKNKIAPAKSIYRIISQPMVWKCPFLWAKKA